MHPRTGTVAALLLAGCEAPPDAATCAPADAATVTLDATGFFRTEKLCDRWWLVTPEGRVFWSAGINSAQPYGTTNGVTGAQAYRETVLATYDSDDAWADATVARLHAWGFNTAGSWSSTALLAPRMPVAPNLSLGMDDWQAGTSPDWFDPAWEAAVRERALAEAGPWRDEPNIVGWFIDNENRWGPDWRGTEPMLDVYLALPDDAPGHLAALEALSAADPETTFLVLLAERYFSVTTAAIREADPNHLVLGNRDVATMSRPELIDVAARHVDVLSFNSYALYDVVAAAAVELSGGLPADDALAAHHALVDKPILVSEFGFRAADSGLPNTWPVIYPTLATQQDRADAFEAAVTEHQAAPWIVGMHWFEWADQPADGRFDGENNNWGLVTEQDVPWEALTARTAAVFPRAYERLRVPRQ